MKNPKLPPIDKRWPGRYKIRCKFWSPDGKTALEIETPVSSDVMKQVRAVLMTAFNTKDVAP